MIKLRGPGEPETRGFGTTNLVQFYAHAVCMILRSRIPIQRTDCPDGIEIQYAQSLLVRRVINAVMEIPGSRKRQARRSYDLETMDGCSLYRGI